MSTFEVPFVLSALFDEVLRLSSASVWTKYSIQAYLAATLNL
jgi:hypothetical protein